MAEFFKMEKVLPNIRSNFPDLNLGDMTKENPDPTYVLRDSIGTVTSLRFFKSTLISRLLSGCSEGKIYLWNLKSKRKEFTIDGHNGKAVIWIDQIGTIGNKLVSHGQNEKIRFWELGSRGWLETGNIPSSPAGFCGGTQSNNLISVAGSELSDILLIDLDSKRTVRTLHPSKQEKPRGICMCLKFIPTLCNGSLLLAGYEDGSIVLWDSHQGKEVSCLMPHKESVMCLDFDEKNMRGISGSADDKVIEWKLNEHKIMQLGNSVSLRNPGVSSISIRSDGKIVATGGWDAKVRVFSCKKFKPLAVLGYHRANIQCVAFSTESLPEKLLAAGSKDRHISLWSVFNN